MIPYIKLRYYDELHKTGTLTPILTLLGLKFLHVVLKGEPKELPAASLNLSFFLSISCGPKCFWMDSENMASSPRIKK